MPDADMWLDGQVNEFWIGIGLVVGLLLSKSEVLNIFSCPLITLLS